MRRLVARSPTSRPNASSGSRLISEESEYTVGYGKPPINTQFKKAVSGNPNGGRSRRKQRRDEIIATIRDEVVPLRINGKSVKIPMFEAMIRASVARVMKNGSPRDLHRLMELLDHYGGSSMDERAAESKQVASEVMNKILTAFDRTVANDPGKTQAASDERKRRENEEAAILSQFPECVDALQRLWRDHSREHRKEFAPTYLSEQVARANKRPMLAPPNQVPPIG